MRPSDYEEVEAQVDDFDPALIAAWALRDQAYCVEIDGNPEAGFGAGLMRSGYFVAWSWGSRRMWRCVPHITRFVRDVMVPTIYEAGGWRVEARALASNEQACRWLERMGAERQGLLENFGKNGEDFILYQWTRNRHDVLCREAAEASAAPHTSSAR